MSKIKTGTTLTTAYVVEGDTTGALVIQTGATPTTAMTIDTSQNVGIGTSSPASDSLLHIFSASDKARVSVQRSGVSKAWFGQDGSGTAYIYNEANNDTRFYNNSTERMRLTAAGLLQFNSGYGSVATAYGCRAWINFNGTGTVAIRSSGNVSSITDNGTGDYTLNFTTAMPDVNYGVSYALNGGDTVSTRYNANIYGTNQAGSPTLMSTTQLRILCGVTHTTGVSDHNVVTVSIFR